MSMLAERLERLESVVRALSGRSDNALRFLQRVVGILKKLGYKVITSPRVYQDKDIASVTLSFPASDAGEAGTGVVDVLKRKFGVDLTHEKRHDTSGGPYTYWSGDSYRGFSVEVTESIVRGRAIVHVNCYLTH